MDNQPKQLAFLWLFEDETPAVKTETKSNKVSSPAKKTSTKTATKKTNTKALSDNKANKANKTETAQGVVNTNKDVELLAAWAGDVIMFASLALAIFFS